MAAALSVGLSAAPVASAQQIRASFTRYVPSIGVQPAGHSPMPRMTVIESQRTAVHPIVVGGGIIGSALGLWGGIEAGEWMADHWGLDCCGDDPGLAAKGFAGLIGSAAGTVLGTSLGARLGGTAQPTFGRRLRDLGVGTLLALAITAGTAKVTDGPTAPFISFVVTQGGYAGLSNGRW
jgi:hypothetical protein